MAIWSQELSEYEIEFHPRTAIKGQALADFVAEFSYAPDMGRAETDLNDNELTRKRKVDPTGPIWELYVDGASNARGAGAGIILINPDGEKL